MDESTRRAAHEAFEKKWFERAREGGTGAIGCLDAALDAVAARTEGLRAPLSDAEIIRLDRIAMEAARSMARTIHRESLLFDSPDATNIRQAAIRAVVAHLNQPATDPLRDAVVEAAIHALWTHDANPKIYFMPELERAVRTLLARGRPKRKAEIPESWAMAFDMTKGGARLYHTAYSSQDKQEHIDAGYYVLYPIPARTVEIE